METCPGPLLWFPVPAEGEWDGDSALLVCVECREVIVLTGTSTSMDDRHSGTIALAG